MRLQLAFAASEYSEPLPDVAIVPKDAPRADHPSSALLLIEVSESSLRFDRDVKAKVHAEAGVQEYWVVNVPRRVVEVLSKPTQRGYAELCEADPGEALAVPGFPDVTLAVSALFD